MSRNTMKKIGSQMTNEKNNCNAHARQRVNMLNI